jgi:hypothetical protein
VRFNRWRLRIGVGCDAAATAAPASNQGSEELERRQALRDHYGLAELKILPGNIRYPRITGFEWVVATAAARARRSST